MGVETWLAIIGALFAIAGLVSGGFAVVRSTYTRTQLEILRASVDDYEKRTDQLIEERDEERRVRTETMAKLEAAQREVQVLRDIVTSKQEISDLRALIEINHKENSQISTGILGRLERVLTRLGVLENEADIGGGNGG